MKRKLVALFATAALATAMLAGCGSSTSTTTDTADTTATEASAEAEAVDVAADTSADIGGGFTEYPIFEDYELEFINLSAVYFQPVPMSNGNENIEDFDIHLEADISALENDLGYGVGDWIPYLTVDYAVTDQATGEVKAEGTFMEMSASDGPHYGANIKLADAGTYNVTFTIHSPEENGYLLHTDAETGPGGSFDTYFADGNLTYTYEGWDYVPQEW